MGIIAWLGFELVYFVTAVQHFSHYAKWMSLVNGMKVLFSLLHREETTHRQVLIREQLVWIPNFSFCMTMIARPKLASSVYSNIFLLAGCAKRNGILPFLRTLPRSETPKGSSSIWTRYGESISGNNNRYGTSLSKVMISDQAMRAEQREIRAWKMSNCLTYPGYRYVKYRDM